MSTTTTKKTYIHTFDYPSFSSCLGLLRCQLSAAAMPALLTVGQNCKHVTISRGKLLDPIFQFVHVNYGVCS